MNAYEKIAGLKDSDFRRHTGIERGTFEKMLEILKEAEAKKKAAGGKPNELSMEERLLMCLEYLREYRTYFHISHGYGVSESTCYRNCVWIENILVASKEFRLPSRKELLNQNEIEVITVDACESPVERPKKSKSGIIPARKSDTASKPKL